MIVNGKFAINPQFEWTGGGYASTTEDLARWAKAMYEGHAFDAVLLPEMLAGTLAPMLGKEAKYGLGVIIRPTTFGTSYGHSGFFPGYITEMIYFPERKIALAIQVNSSAPRVIGKPPMIFSGADAIFILTGKERITAGCHHFRQAKYQSFRRGIGDGGSKNKTVLPSNNLELPALVSFARINEL